MSREWTEAEKDVLLDLAEAVISMGSETGGFGGERAISGSTLSATPEDLAGLERMVRLEEKSFTARTAETYRSAERRTEAAEAPWRLVLPGRPGSAHASEILEALEPLMGKRGCRREQVLYFDCPKSEPVEDPIDLWTRRNEAAIEEGTYFLVAGPSDSGVAEAARYLAHGKLVGRLCFQQPAQYGAYANKVLEAEGTYREPEDARPEVVAFNPTDDDAVKWTLDAITRPVCGLLAEKLDDLEVVPLFGGEARWMSLAQASAGHRLPNLSGDSFCSERGDSGGHRGEVYRDGGRRSRRDSGHSRPLAFLVGHGAVDEQAGWPIGTLKGHGSREMLDPKAARELEALAPKGVAVLHACGSAGCSRDSVLASGAVSPIEQLQSGSDHQSLVANELLLHANGPLAIVAHDDIIHLAGMSILDESLLEGKEQVVAVRPIMCLLEALLGGTPVGVAMQRIRRDFYLRTSLLERLRHRCAMSLKAGRASLDIEKLQLLLAYRRWSVVRNWVILGDPRVALDGGPGRANTGDHYRSSRYR